MKVETLVNGEITMVIAPENEMETELLKALLKQKSVTISEVSSGLTVFNKTYRGGILISKQTEEGQSLS